MSPYPRALLEHFQAPQHKRRLDDATHSGEARNPLCGDELRIDVRVTDGSVVEVGFDGVGCAISLGAADMLASRWQGGAAQDAARMDLEAVQDEIGMQVPEGRRRCAMLAVDALRQALGSKTP